MKCALVTGGSRGIGRAICLELADLGYYVWSITAQMPKAAVTLAGIRGRGVGMGN